MSEYDEALHKLRPESRKKLKGLMKAAQKKRKAGKTATFRMKGTPKS